MSALARTAAACLLLPAAVLAAEPPPPAVTVYAAGDIALCQSDPARSSAAATAAVVAAGLAADPLAAVLMLGDATYPRGAPAEFTRCYAPTWGRFRDRTFPAPGNHEYGTPGAAGYFGYFGAAAGRGYYSVQMGTWRLYSLNSNLGPEQHAAQLAWLRDELMHHPTRCTLAYWHHPLYSSGMHGNIAQMKDVWHVLYNAGAELVLSGHDHIYERFAPQDADSRRDDAHGIRQFIVGTGGAFATPVLWPRANSDVRDPNRIGVLKLVLGVDSYEWEFLDASLEGTGERLDHGAARCH
ncbi:MAG: alkaline phosphatase [Massilia sp.]|nr:alkaline phosphatase [Massilia sp.]